MSTYKRQTKHPYTGKWESATWHDDLFGQHHYGVIFPSDEKIAKLSPGLYWVDRAREIAFDPEKISLETE